MSDDARWITECRRRVKTAMRLLEEINDDLDRKDAERAVAIMERVRNAAEPRG